MNERLTGMNLLIVEDDPNLRILWEDVFEQQGYTSTSVETAKGARQAMTTGQYDLVLLDYYLGDGDATDVLNELPSGAPVLVVTGAASNMNGEMFDLSPHITAVLRKPVDIENLIEVSEYLAAGAGPMPKDRQSRLGLEIRD